MHTWDTVRGMSEDMAEKATMPYAMTILPPCLSASVPPRSWVPSDKCTGSWYATHTISLDWYAKECKTCF